MSKRFLFCASLILAGCNSTPSDGDIEDFLLPLFSSCQNIKVVDIDKTNGYDVEDGLYKVEFTYSIKETSNELKNLHQKYLEEIEIRKQFYKDKEIFESKVKEIDDEMRNLAIEHAKTKPQLTDFFNHSDINKLSEAERNAYFARGREWEQQRSVIEQPKKNELSNLYQAWDKRKAEMGKLTFFDSYGLSELDTAIVGRYIRGCSRTALDFLPRRGMPQQEREKVSVTYEPGSWFEKYEPDMKGTLIMRKTEQGWKAARN